MRYYGLFVTFGRTNRLLQLAQTECMDLAHLTSLLLGHSRFDIGAHLGSRCITRNLFARRDGHDAIVAAALLYNCDRLLSDVLGSSKAFLLMDLPDL